MKCKICGVRLSSSATAYKHLWHSHHNIALGFIFKNTELEGFECTNQEGAKHVEVTQEVSIYKRQKIMQDFFEKFSKKYGWYLIGRMWCGGSPYEVYNTGRCPNMMMFECACGWDSGGIYTLDCTPRWLTFTIGVAKLLEESSGRKVIVKEKVIDIRNTNIISSTDIPSVKPFTRESQRVTSEQK